jgi:hypothetical protein
MQGVPTKAPPMPNVEDFSDDELEVGDDDLEFVAQHRAYMGGFTTSDVPRDSRCATVDASPTGTVAIV